MRASMTQPSHAVPCRAVPCPAVNQLQTQASRSSQAAKPTTWRAPSPTLLATSPACIGRAGLGRDCMATDGVTRHGRGPGSTPLPVHGISRHGVACHGMASHGKGAACHVPTKCSRAMAGAADAPSRAPPRNTRAPPRRRALPAPWQPQWRVQHAPWLHGVRAGNA